MLEALPVVELWEFDEPTEVDVPPIARSDRISDPEREHAEERLRARFDILADELEEAAAGMSSTRRALALPAYTGILALGEDAIPLLLRRVETARSRPVFLRALASLTAFQPGAGRETVEEAAKEWVRWGRREGRIA